MIVIDSSGSIGEDNFELVRAFTKNVVDLADAAHVRIGVMQFSKQVYHEFYMNDYLTTVDGVEIQDKAAMQEHLDGMPYRLSGTNTHLAINAAVEEYFTPSKGARSGVKRHLLLVTDGESNVPAETLKAASKAKREADIFLFAVGIRMNTEAQVEELSAIASPPALQNVLHVQEFDELDDIFTKIFIHFCRSEFCKMCGLDGACFLFFSKLPYFF